VQNNCSVELSQKVATAVQLARVKYLVLGSVTNQALTVCKTDV